MSVAMEIITSFSLAELRRLVALKENQPQIESLMERRDHLMEEARLLQNQIDELIDTGSTRGRRKRIGPSVKHLCIEAFRSRKNIPMTAAEVKDTILAKNPHRNNRTFYNQVFIALTRSNMFKKGRSGKFTLDEKSAAHPEVDRFPAGGA
jgi:DNA-binding transcriptional MerR regulator